MFWEKRLCNNDVRQRKERKEKKINLHVKESETLFFPENLMVNIFISTSVMLQNKSKKTL